ncbi:PaaX family transcriptional regulator C-terminal domain-containing protein [Pukyongiella litopenaei]|uniref:PaaX family transcriptional regulator n=1 Tax=Pukyongiella litopenaei TaxID=2605946 RepID=A0A2S0MKF9_9RHOB|nr:PaaX family transcriptional regulator C-terminal domain-containing protein [Pukyongiella litopenaei]AVO36342.1 PaaX family transcriptional regulator [Pukyongiella litopenaei]
MQPDAALIPFPGPGPGWTPGIDGLVDCLLGDRPPRVWSLLVTIFGDLARDGSARLGGQLINRLTDRMRLKPEAVRVALHRLRKDSWIESERAGRQSLYRLTPSGRTQSRAASPLIYARTAPAELAWLVLADRTEMPEGAASGIVWILPHAGLTTYPPRDPGHLHLPLPADTHVPGWIRTRVCDENLVRMAHEFEARLVRLDDLCGSRPRFGPIETAMLRVLLVHGWRRIALKAPTLPDHVFPETWRGGSCRSRVTALLDRLPRPHPDDLVADITA